MLLAWKTKTKNTIEIGSGPIGFLFRYNYDAIIDFDFYQVHWKDITWFYVKLQSSSYTP